MRRCVLFVALLCFPNAEDLDSGGYEDEPRGVRSGRCKLQLPHSDKQAPDPGQVGHAGIRGAARAEEPPLALYDLEADPGEATNIAAKHPDGVRRLDALADAARQQWGDGSRGVSVREYVRPVKVDLVGRVNQPNAP